MEPRKWVGPLFLCGAVLIVPWTIWLGWTLPTQHAAAHWRDAWVGLDVALAVAMLCVAYTAWRWSIWLEAAAAATGTLLLCDAWFDILLERGGGFWAAIAEAGLAEIPLAILCFWIARDAERFWRTVATSLGDPTGHVRGSPRLRTRGRRRPEDRSPAASP